MQANERIRYRTTSCVRHGWFLKQGRKYLHLQLVGDPGRRRVPLAESRFITPLDTPAAGA